MSRAVAKSEKSRQNHQFNSVHAIFKKVTGDIAEPMHWLSDYAAGKCTLNLSAPD